MHLHELNLVRSEKMKIILFDVKQLLLPREKIIRSTGKFYEKAVLLVYCYMSSRIHSADPSEVYGTDSKYREKECFRKNDLI